MYTLPRALHSDAGVAKAIASVDMVYAEDSAEGMATWAGVSLHRTNTAQTEAGRGLVVGIDDRGDVGVSCERDTEGQTWSLLANANGAEGGQGARSSHYDCGRACRPT